MSLHASMLRPRAPETEADAAALAVTTTSAQAHAVPAAIRFLEGLASDVAPGGRLGVRLDPGVDALQAAGLLLRQALPEAGVSEIVRCVVAALTAGVGGSPTRPFWYAKRRQLWWAGRMVKTLRTAATTQLIVLAAFEAAGWTPSLAIQLPGARGRKAKQRIHDTIKSLNEGLEAGTLRFHADGDGCIAWRVDA